MIKKTENSINSQAFFLLFQILLCSLFSFSPALGQSNTKIVELEKRLQTLKGTEKTVVLIELSEAYKSLSVTRSLDYANQALDMAHKAKDKPLEARANEALAAVYVSAGKYAEALKHYEAQMKLISGSGKAEDIAVCYYNQGAMHRSLGRSSKAVSSFESCIPIARKVHNKSLLLDAYESLFSIHLDEKKYKKAFDYFKAYAQIKDSTFVLDKQREVSVWQKQYIETKTQADSMLQQKDSVIQQVSDDLKDVEGQRDTLKVLTKEQQQQIAILNYQQKLSEEEIKNQRLRLNLLIAIVAFILFLTTLVYRQYRFKKRANLELATRNDQISRQKDEIERQKTAITDSIHYASRIQNALIPSLERLNRLLPEHFVFMKPRDIVSGDFYWISETENNILLAAADCTGHGVPGAFMSMLGITLLNAIADRFENSGSGQLLDNLRAEVKHALGQEGRDEEPKDGMDISLCVFSRDFRSLQFSGAYNPLMLIRNKEIVFYKADRQPIAVYPKERPFVTNQVELQAGDVLYLFSDGYIDQVGGEKGDKFKMNKLKELLLEIHPLSMQEQKLRLEEHILQWQKSYQQVDDMLIIGLRIA